MISRGASLRVEAGITPLQALLGRYGLEPDDRRSFNKLVLETAHLLVNNGADINAGDSDNGTPLQLAALHGYFTTVTYLVSIGAEVNLTTGHERLPALTLLCSSFDRAWICSDEVTEQLQAVECLLKRGAYVTSSTQKNGMSDPTALTEACAAGRLDLVRLLLRYGASTRSPMTIVGRRPQRMTFQGLRPPPQVTPSDIVQFLRDSGAAPNVKFKEGRKCTSDLEYCCSNGLFDHVLELLMSGVDVDKPSGLAPLRFPIQEAVLGGYYDIVRLLLNAGAKKGIDRAIKGATVRGYFHIADLLENHCK